ncbi:unnamed protein product [Knipowitschia caucasica]|uniref:Uncharacterized protein n=1 Tax=Knipowitschia caucasica TaxID=637954 RepID=A0AAV2MUI4_KNICA
MAVDSFLESVKPPESAEDLVDWFLFRVQREPWALGGAVVVAVFILGTICLMVFALVYGCCCNTSEMTPTRKKIQNQII